MMNEKDDKLSEALVGVGYRHGVCADEFISAFAGVPMKEKELMDLLNGGLVILSPEPNRHDKHAVGVYDLNMRLIAHLWSVQAPAMRVKMKDLGVKYLRARIERLDTAADVIFIRPLQPLHLDIKAPEGEDIDSMWAADIPDVLQSKESENLKVGMALLRDDLESAEKWDCQLQHRIDGILSNLPADLSAMQFTEGVELYNTMVTSKIREVRMMSDMVLRKFVNRGSKKQMQWWNETWLPSFYDWTSQGDLMAIYRAAGYTVERVKDILDDAPCKLFLLYQTSKFRFAKHLLYSYLPKDVYDRLLTLLAVWELMKKEQQVEESAAPMRQPVSAVQVNQATINILTSGNLIGKEINYGK